MLVKKGFKNQRSILANNRDKNQGFFSRYFLPKSSRGQIWVETMIYTLIAFALIGLVLAFVKPKIQETQDKGVIEQSIGILENIDFVIKNLGGPGNQRIVEVGLNKGTLSINGVNDTISFKMESRYVYSQPGQTINVGDTEAYTRQVGKFYEVTLTRNYLGIYNITVGGQDTVRDLTRAAIPYKLVISDNGGNVVNMNVTT